MAVSTVACKNVCDTLSAAFVCADYDEDSSLPKVIMMDNILPCYL
jgi:hypothetical protein